MLITIVPSLLSTRQCAIAPAQPGGVKGRPTKALELLLGRKDGFYAGVGFSGLDSDSGALLVYRFPYGLRTVR